MEEIPINVNRKSFTVLVADDDEDDRNFIRKAWNKSGFGHDLRFVEDGEELTDYLYHTGKYSVPISSPRPAIILLDLNMPKKGGLEALREIKADPILRRIPIIVLTATKAEEDICRSYKYGTNSFIIKPVTVGSLLYVLRFLDKFWLETPALVPESN
jgi:CheY-like chemotaxis protein